MAPSACAYVTDGSTRTPRVRSTAIARSRMLCLHERPRTTPHFFAIRISFPGAGEDRRFSRRTVKVVALKFSRRRELGEQAIILDASHGEKFESRIRCIPRAGAARAANVL